ncbi:hypothetical protein GCM10011533_30130 [Streptosporangium jomthongense]|nr:hypothetical protein GCM10011533_30130 [Streptosporangium jomthongense]
MKLAIGCSSNHEWAYFVFSTSPNMLGADLRDEYSEIQAQVLWSGDIITHGFTQDHGSRFLMFDDSAEVIRRLETNPTMIAEFSWYGEGRVQFAVKLTGGSDAIKYVRSKCR